MNSKTRRRLRKKLIARDGNRCNLCKKSPPSGNLVIEHKDNNPKNNALTNLQLACRQCNYRKNPRRPLTSSERKPKIDTCDKYAEIEKKFRTYVHQRVTDNVEVPYNDLKNDGAEKFDFSPTTAGRYLDKLCSSEGVFTKKQYSKTTVVRYKPELPRLD